MEQDTSAEKGAFHRIQMAKFAIEAEATMEAERNLKIQDAGEELRRKGHAQGALVNFLGDQLLSQYLELSVCEAVECDKSSISKSGIISVSGDTETMFTASKKSDSDTKATWRSFKTKSRKDRVSSGRNNDVAKRI